MLKQLYYATGIALLAGNLREGWHFYWLFVWLTYLSIWLSIGGYYTLYLAYHTLGRDLRALTFFVKLVCFMKWAEWKNWNVLKMFKSTVEKMPDKIMFYFEDQTWTFKEVDEYSNRIANFFLLSGYQKGDTVALLMENRPEYVATWLGLAKIGVVSALINYNQKLQALIHAVQAAKSKAIIYGPEFTPDVSTVYDSLKNDKFSSFQSFCSGLTTYNPEEGEIACKMSESTNLDLALQTVPIQLTGAHLYKSINFSDKLLYIYTSGTTGLPKAAVIRHSRFLLGSAVPVFAAGLRTNDTVYNPLPLYHSSAEVLSCGTSMNIGLTVALRKKFSAKAYWKDCVKYNATVCQYIGEICRYLLNTPKCNEETQHRVRLMFGNGLRPQIWTAFVNRFKIPNVAEFYGSTEGNSNIINNENVKGAVGFLPVLFQKFFPLGLIKVDKETGEVIRDNNGLCVRCKPGEPGEWVGEIVRNHALRDFHGYADESATRKKILQSVWKKDDICFRSGDILVMDEFGWLYFKDRVGDTFRWKGENVSTTEVEAMISNMVHLKDAAVYGVEIPGAEGRAGMAAIHDPEGEVDIKEFGNAVKEQLPSFARPIFVRLVKKLDITGTYKLRKFNLQREGYNISAIDKTGCNDKFFFLHPKAGTYQDLTSDLVNSISNGLIML